MNKVKQLLRESINLLETNMVARIINKPLGRDNWYNGIVGKAKFEVKLTEDPSDLGIDGGKIIKLNIFLPDLQYSNMNTILVSFDKGVWVLKPIGEKTQEYYDAVMSLFK